MTDTKDGGPAFSRPSVVWKTPSGDQTGEQGHPGMSLRDYFAGQALAGMTSTPVDLGSGLDSQAEFEAARDDVIKGFAVCAYKYADAMLRAREQGEG